MHILPHINEHSPIEDSATERTSRAGTTEEQVPDLISECLRTRIRAEAVVGIRTTEGDRDDLALGLACLNGRCEELAVDEAGTREGGTTASLQQV